MNYEAHEAFVIGVSAASVVLLLLSVAVAISANMLYRAVVLEREIATRRVLGARRSAIVRMFLLESAGPTLVGALIGSLLVVFLDSFSSAAFSRSSLLIALTTVACCAAAGGWLAARHASNTPFSKSGLFRGASDKRGEY